MATRTTKRRKGTGKHAGWFDRCVTSVKKGGSAADPEAVCGSVLKRKRGQNPDDMPRLSVPVGEIVARYGTMRGGAFTIARQKLEQIRKEQKKHGGKILEAVDSSGKRVAYVLVVREGRTSNPQDQLTVKQFYNFGYAAGEQDKRSIDVGLSLDTSVELPKRFEFIWDRALGNGEVRANKKSVMSSKFSKGYYDAYRGMRRKHNPEAASASMYSSFHGAPSTAIDEYQEEEHYHSNLAALGELVGLKVRTVSGYDVTLGFEGGGSGSGSESNPKVVEEVYSADSSVVGRRVNELQAKGYKVTTGLLGIGSNRKIHVMIRPGTSGDKSLSKVGKVSNPDGRPAPMQPKSVAVRKLAIAVKSKYGNSADISHIITASHEPDVMAKAGRDTEWWDRLAEAAIADGLTIDEFDEIVEKRTDNPQADTTIHISTLPQSSGKVLYGARVGGYVVAHGFKTKREAHQAATEWKNKNTNPNRQSNAFWPFDSFSKATIYHVPSGHKFHTSTTHKGHTIYKSESKDGYVVPEIERESVFDSVKDAKKFIDHWAKQGNPSKVHTYLEAIRGSHYMGDSAQEGLSSYHAAKATVDAGRIREPLKRLSAVRAALKSHRVTVSLDGDKVRVHRPDTGTTFYVGSKESNPKGKRHGHSIGPVAASQQFVGDTIGAIYRPMNEFIGTVGGVVDKGFKSVGIKGNPHYTIDQLMDRIREEGKTIEDVERAISQTKAALGKADLPSATKKIYQHHLKMYSSALKRMGKGGEAGRIKEEIRQLKKEMKDRGVRTISFMNAGLTSDESKYNSRLYKLKLDLEQAEGKRSNPRRSNPDHVLLCSTENGKNLQLVGGDQSLDLDALKIDGELAEKELITIGEVWGVNYRTEKVFGDGGSEDGLTEYIHIHGPKETKPPRGGDLWADAVPPKDNVFGTGELPTLIYDKRNQKLLLSGGIYFVNQPLTGTSPGLEN